MECAICLEQIAESPHVTACNHSFHFKCINTWLKVNNSCPCCRTHFKEAGPLCGNSGFFTEEELQSDHLLPRYFESLETTPTPTRVDNTDADDVGIYYEDSDIILFNYAEVA
jgi:hypothetical protein